jgi:hypothetical protein
VKLSLKLGLVGLFVYLSFGMLLEFLLFLEAPFYTGDAFLRRLWNLAHAHGTLAWLVYLVHWQLVDRLDLHGGLRRVSRRCCALGALLLPLGFLLGAIGHGDDRPSAAIGLVPVGGTLLGAALLLPVLAGRERFRNGNQTGSEGVSPT